MFRRSVVNALTRHGMSSSFEGLRAVPRYSANVRFFSGEAAAPVMPNVAATMTFEPQTVVYHREEGKELDQENLFAVVGLSGTQFKITKGDIINSEKLNYEVGTEVYLDDVYLVGSPDFTVVGRPYVRGARVKVACEEQTLDEKIWVFKKKRRKNHRRMNGFRRRVTILRVLEIEDGEDRSLVA